MKHAESRGTRLLHSTNEKAVLVWELSGEVITAEVIMQQRTLGNSLHYTMFVLHMYMYVTAHDIMMT